MNNYIYYNIRFTNDTDNETTEAIYKNNRLSDIIKRNDTSNYDVSVLKASIPTNNIPYLVFNEDEKINYTITFVYGEGSENKVLELKQFDETKYGFDYEYYNANQFIWSLNETLRLLWESNNDFNSILPPYFTYEDGYFKLTIDAEYNLNVKIRISYSLQKLLKGFVYEYYEDFNEYEFIVGNVGSVNNFNERNYVTITTDKPTNNSILKRIMIYSNNLPYNLEFDTTKSTYEKLLKDIFIENYQNVILYDAEDEIEWRSLETLLELKTLDIHIRWQDKNGNDYPLLINQEVKLKLVFRKN